MSIDFHSEDIRGTYATRTADDAWGEAMREIVDPADKRVADIGCGGGIYSRAWAELGASSVVGVDLSAAMIDDAIATSEAYPSLTFIQAPAADTGLPDASVDIVFSRALIHHLPDLTPAFTEAFRILRADGTMIVQDRTVEDVLRPASPTHLRGYFFERFPRLLRIERDRRPTSGDVIDSLNTVGFADTATTQLSEPRRQYKTTNELQYDLRARTGRSILHSLSDRELEDLIAYVEPRIDHAMPIQEADFWTVWRATKPGFR